MGESLANKYRPKSFEQVVGQEHAVQILQSVLKANTFKQGYLFTGGAGTGKTTLARIFASQIDGEIVEIDAASNNGVDNVRDLREKVQYKSLNKAYKVYIIDEVHMLSTGAFNALLKTLEEPPSHAVFILCTTDPQKIPATILSRVQRYDFRRIEKDKIINQLQNIVDWENIDIDNQTGGGQPEALFDIRPEVFDYVAKLADGGMRDAISILDTCMGYKNTLAMEDLFEILGTAPVDSYIDILAAVTNKDSKGVVETLEKIHLDGKDLKQFVKGITNFIVDLKKLLLFRDMEYVTAPGVYEDDMKSLINLINNKVDVNTALDSYYASFVKLMNIIKYEQSPKTLIQGELLSLCQE